MKHYSNGSLNSGAMNKNPFREYFETNKKLWNGLTGINEKSEFYAVNGFKSGKNSLNFIELEELGDVAGKSLLHLQCHFGMDTLSWARLGAHVTGIDFSEKAIQLAESLSKELAIDARFIQSNLYDLPSVLREKFDIVYTSYGVLCWLPDLKEWGRIIHHFLKENGIFYIVTFHPILGMFDDDGSMKEGYFPGPEPTRYEANGSYADRDVTFHHVSYEWHHTLSDVVNALTRTGMAIEFLHEFPFSVYGDRPFLEKGEDGLWRHRDRNIKIPMIFSIKARKPASV